VEWVTQFIDLVLHLDQHLGVFLREHGAWIYLLLFVIVFCETGLVVTPFLPGDSLLFVAGTLAAAGGMNVYGLMAVLVAAAIVGDTVNYTIGAFLGTKVFQRDYRWINRSHLERTHSFYERHGGKTIIIARFVPIVRTFAPFVAGAASMTYGRFIAYNILGGLLWVISLVLAGYFFGNLPWVQKNLSLVILGIIALSLVPIAVEYWRHHRH